MNLKDKLKAKWYLFLIPLIVALYSSSRLYSLSYKIIVFLIVFIALSVGLVWGLAVSDK